MTNLVAIVITLVTNTIVTNNGIRQWQSPPQGLFAEVYGESGPWMKEPDEESTETQIIEKRIAHTEIDGKVFDNLIGEKILSSTTRTKKKFVEWREIAFRTNALQTGAWWTNASVRVFANVTNWTITSGGSK